MKYPPEQLEDLALRASTLDERLSDQYEPLPGLKSDADIAARRLATWCRHAASGDWALFAKRLRRDGLTMEQVMPRLSAIRRRADAALPGWIEDAAWIVPAMLTDAPLAVVAALRRAEAQPFEPLFYGLVTAAQDRRNALLPASARTCISDAVRTEMSRALLASATKLCGMAIYENFAVIRDAWQKEIGLAPDDSSSRTRHYERFITEMRRSGLQRLFDTKPVLLRLLASLTRQWIDTTAEFLRRLDADYIAIRQDLVAGATDTPVTAVETGLSDLHNFGRSVYIVRFGDGTAAVYKPKDVTVDARWGALIDWLNGQGAPIDLKAARVIARDGYGWCEFIAHGDVADRAAARRFFRRAGALLGLWHLLVGSDMHEENMIAAGEQPVPIDLEMLLQAHDPSAATDAPPMRAQEAAGKRLAQSVLTTGLLPSWLRTPETALIALGGLHDSVGGPMPEQRWAQINTDAMAPSRAPWQPGRHANLPRLDGSTIKLPDYLDALMDGCGAYLRFILAHKRELTSKTGPLAAFAGVPIRRVLKPTRFYALLLDRLRNHRDMRDGTEWSAHLDFVSRLADWDKDDEALWPLFAAERRALGDLNIPFFVHAADGDRVRDGSGSSAASGLQPALIEALRRIETLDEAEIAWQLDVIRLTVVDDPLSNPDFFREKARQRAGLSSTSPKLDRSAAMAEADRIAGELRQRALRDSGGAAWIGLDPLADGGGWQLVPLGSDLYGGAPGVSLFLAAHARIADNPASRELALEGLAPSRYIIRSSGAARFARVSGIGGSSGISSLIYALITTARLLDEQSLVDDALAATRLLSDDVIGADKVYDIIGGAAGAILCLLKLHRETGDAHVLDHAVACGQHLLRSRPQTTNGPGLWKHLGSRPLTGFSHGAAGFAYALAALAKTSGNAAFTAAAEGCLAYERSLFSAERGNWPDLRETGDGKGASFPCQWCHGAGGIGLARLGMQRFGDRNIEIARDIDIAVATVRRGPPSPIDTWCCGNLGNIETLAEAARALGDSELDDEASRRTYEILATARRTGSFGWNAAGDAENLGLFRGLAGVGYSLLRRAAPGQLPNVLIWE
ncbi:MAG: type 2 lantipeptide synthetase LanM [Alphaproteobacteria bacterium]|nr:type 2 lantipeptide synthetase LanM [Alphaproteobacteria bacterium]